MKIRFVFHKPKGERGVGKAIVAWTWLLGCFYNWKVLKYNYSHVEVWIPDKDGNFIVGERKTYEKFAATGMYVYSMIYTHVGQCFSSTTRGKWRGVRFAPASEVIGKHPERWDCLEVDVDPERLEVALDEATLREGLKYDFLGLFGFFLPCVIQNRKKWYCSEVCTWFAYLCRIIPVRYKRISPRRLAYVLSKIWGLPISLKGSPMVKSYIPI